MTKPKNKVETVTIRISTTPQVAALLDELVQGQMHGKTQADVAEELLRSALRPLMPDVKLTAKPPSTRTKRQGDNA